MEGVFFRKNTNNNNNLSIMFPSFKNKYSISLLVTLFILMTTFNGCSLQFQKYKRRICDFKQIGIDIICLRINAEKEIDVIQ